MLALCSANTNDAHRRINNNVTISHTFTLEIKDNSEDIQSQWHNERKSMLACKWRYLDLSMHKKSEPLGSPFDTVVD
jgi:hypothetical protein